MKDGRFADRDGRRRGDFERIQLGAMIRRVDVARLGSSVRAAFN